MVKLRFELKTIISQQVTTILLRCYSLKADRSCLSLNHEALEMKTGMTEDEKGNWLMERKYSYVTLAHTISVASFCSFDNELHFVCCLFILLVVNYS